MAKNKNRQQPSKPQARSSQQEHGRGAQESVSEPASSAPSPMDMARKGKQKRFGHN
ncbi:hypothetical protein [Streptomyces sp. NPDC101132]|uniref:hypothetical protein n=1 Tax=Streptomyces sp. NPDC101132 TaxID=3366110 RepID=UPI0037F5E942